MFTTIYGFKLKMNNLQLLESFGFTKIQSEIFLFIYKYWAKPASTVAQAIWIERTNTYKSLQVLVKKWFIAETNKNWIKHFFVANKNIFNNKLEEQKKELEEQFKKLPQLEAALLRLDENRVSSLPQMRFFEWKSGIKNLFDDIYHIVVQKELLVIKMFGSNTFESQSNSTKNLLYYTDNFFEKLTSNWIHVDAYLWNWILILESIFKTNNFDNIKNLPADNASINLFIVGNTIYIMIFKQVPFWLKIESIELANMLHFLLKQTDK
jgi:hypothetical protein